MKKENEKKKNSQINLITRNRCFDLKIFEVFTAGLVLSGDEIKSIRLRSISIKDSYVLNKKNEIYIFNMYIGRYKNSRTSSLNFDSRKKRKLLMKKNEIKKILKKTKEKGYIISPLKLFINERGWAKLEIAIAQKLRKYQIKNKLKEKEIKKKIINEDFFYEKLY